MTIDQLLDFLINKRLPLIRLDLFEDKLEGTKLEHLVLNNQSENLRNKLFSNFENWFSNININPNSRNNYSDERKLFQKTNYASCWYCSTHESVAMWNLFSHPNSVSVRINYHTLIKALQSSEIQLSYPSKKPLKIGNVKYTIFRNAESEEQLNKVDFVQGFIKDESFQHENEFRILLEIENIQERNSIGEEHLLKENLINWDKDHDLKVIHFEFSKMKEIPFEIVFHPRSNSWHRNNIMYLLKNSNLNITTSESILSDILN
ncbi:MAG: hypothetical protein IPK88_02330 [Saprospiraceae bacterium]|nr:hypothetical protein [Candidatus Defluviibacterium haderslevense]